MADTIHDFSNLAAQWKTQTNRQLCHYTPAEVCGSGSCSSGTGTECWRRLPRGSDKSWRPQGRSQGARLGSECGQEEYSVWGLQREETVAHMGMGFPKLSLVTLWSQNTRTACLASSPMGFLSLKGMQCLPFRLHGHVDGGWKRPEEKRTMNIQHLCESVCSVSRQRAQKSTEWHGLLLPPPGRRRGERQGQDLGENTGGRLGEGRRS